MLNAQVASLVVAQPLAAARRAPRRSPVACSAAQQQPEQALSRRALALAGAAVLLSVAAPAQQARAFLGFGEKSQEETYTEETRAVVAQMRATLQLKKDDPALVDSVAAMRKVTNDWVAKYRRNGSFTGRASYGNTYSALNAVAGHYNNFGTKYQMPVKRAERALKELDDAELLLERGR